jgi:general nucleoside transport system permease protein
MFFQQLLHVLTTSGLYSNAIQEAVLLLLPALGGVISERSGVVNVAMEGMMLTGAFVAVVVGLRTQNPWIATIAAIFAGGLMALIHAVVSIRFKANQIISGFGINIFAAGLTSLLSLAIFGTFPGPGHLDTAHELPLISVPGLSAIPFLGPVFFTQNLVVYLAVIILIAVHIVLFRTRLGLRLRAVGEHPQAADTAGINIYLLRYGAVVTSGLLSGFSGAFLSIGVNNTFNDNMTGGRGFIALAAMIFGRWTPLGALGGCLLFGFGEALYANNSALSISPFLLKMLPYALTLIVLAGFVGRSVAPAADGIPYDPAGE